MLMAKRQESEGTKNLMAKSAGQICPTLHGYYQLPKEQKVKYLKTPWAKMLFTGLPKKVSAILMDGFLTGTFGTDISNWYLVKNHFQKKSRIIPALAQNPGTYTMLERMYHYSSCSGLIDNYFKMSIAGGQALRNRFDVINNLGIYHVSDILSQQKECLMLDIGSGPGRNAIDMCERSPLLRSRLRVECIDIDEEAIKKGQRLVDHYQFRNIKFLNQSMMKLGDRYGAGADYGLLIGVLCGMEREDRIGLLKVLKRYFRPGAKMVAAVLLDRMAEDDLLCAYILRETTGWGLKYSALGELKDVFEKAGWIYEGYIHEEPTRLYEIGTAVVS